MACSVVLLRSLPPEIAALLPSVVLLENIVINTFYFVGALRLLERDEGTFAAQSVTPLRATSSALAHAIIGLVWQAVLLMLLVRHLSRVVRR